MQKASLKMTTKEKSLQEEKQKSQAEQKEEEKVAAPALDKDVHDNKQALAVESITVT
jgi:hypothetical protein